MKRKISRKIIRIYDFLRRDIPNFFRNIFLFRRELRDFQWWDYHYNLEILKRSLQITADNVEKKGIEVDSSRLKKVQKMRRAIEIIQNLSGIDHIEMAEAELGPIVTREWDFEDVEGRPQYKRLVDDLTDEERDHNRKVYSRAREIEEAEWAELWKIFNGQDHNEYKNLNLDESSWDEWFDGSGMRGWWD